MDDKGISFEGRIQVAEFARIPKDMEQAAMRGEVSVSDIMEARYDLGTTTG